MRDKSGSGRSRKGEPEVQLEVFFHGIADKGQCVGRTAAGETVFVVGPVPGDRALVRVGRKRKGFYRGMVASYLERSSDRVEPPCSHFPTCGGCKWQHLAYPAQLAQKERVVRDAIVRIGKLLPQEWLPMLGADPVFFYRNKMEYTFSNRRWLEALLPGHEEDRFSPVLGFHPPGAFDKVIDIHHCHLQMEPANAVRNTIRTIALKQGLTFYDARMHQGLLRTLLVRVTTLGEIMVALIFGEDNPDVTRSFLGEVQEALPRITSLYASVNTKVNDSLYDLDMELVYGDPTVREKLGEFTYRIGPKSFFQTNTLQALTLYEVVRRFADLKGTERVYDLYTGLGSIALYLAPWADRILGIEEVEAAVEDARMNARDNGVTNVDFLAGDVRALFRPEAVAQWGKPDLIITDPPRAGMHPEVVAALMAVGAPRIIYVSCDPATQARDLQFLSANYHILRMQAVDMFPHTHHIENVALLVAKDKE